MKILVKNNFGRPITFWLEPWGEDYGMMPGDVFEIVPENLTGEVVSDTDAREFYFQIVFDEEIKVYAEGARNLAAGVYRNSERLLCGHNRLWDKT